MPHPTIHLRPRGAPDPMVLQPYPHPMTLIHTFPYTNGTPSGTWEVHPVGNPNCRIAYPRYAWEAVCPRCNRECDGSVSMNGHVVCRPCLSASHGLK